MLCVSSHLLPSFLQSCATAQSAAKAAGCEVVGCAEAENTGGAVIDSVDEGCDADLLKRPQLRWRLLKPVDSIALLKLLASIAACSGMLGLLGLEWPAVVEAARADAMSEMLRLLYLLPLYINSSREGDEEEASGGDAIERWLLCERQRRPGPVPRLAIDELP